MKPALFPRPTGLLAIGFILCGEPNASGSGPPVAVCDAVRQQVEDDWIERD